MKKQITLAQVRAGETFELDGMSFVKLDDMSGSCLILTSDIIKELGTVPFDASGENRKDANNYVGSSLESVVTRWLQNNHPNILQATVKKPIDLTTMDGMVCYGQPLVSVRALTVDEYRKYRRHIPLASDWWWLATGWTTLRSPSSFANYAYYVKTDGTVNDLYVYNANSYCPRPALALTSEILVCVETEDEKTLSSYSEVELLAELQRRVVNHV